jgi:SAM-dependent methyltransferase
MSIKRRLRTPVSRFLHRPFVRRRLERLPVARRFYRGWARTHPIDLLYGVDTSGMVPVTDLRVDPALASHMSPYAGSQPSIIRGAIATLPDLAEHCFIDLGCGKGRPLLVASEFPFRRIVGVELAPDLVTVARANAASIRRHFPERPAIELVQDNAARFRLPAGKVVLFCYHSFDAEIFAQVVDAIEEGLAGPVEHLFVIYYNPVWGDLLDRSPVLKRWYAGTLPYHSSELGFGPDREDSVVIWQSVRNAYARNHAGSDRRIQTNASRGHVELVR